MRHRILATFANRADEIHAIARGVRNGAFVPPHPPDTADARDEKAYYATTYLLVRSVRAGVFAAAVAALF